MIHGDILGERARLSPDRTALIYLPTQQRFTYRELNERSIRCARSWTEQLRLSKGDRVGILATNRVEFLDAFFAAGKTGIILVPLNTRLTPAELAIIVQDSGMKALLYDGDLRATIEQLKSQTLIEHWIALDQPASPSDLQYSNLLAEVESVSSFSAPCDPEEIYCLLYTSGTTGKPKGVMIPHRMVTWNGYNTAICWQLREDDVSPVFTPLYHAGGLAAFLVPIFIAGGTIVLHREFNLPEVCSSIELHQCTVLLGVPTIFKMLIESPEFAGTDLTHVRWFISGGAPLPVELIELYRTRGVVLKQGYGLTEVGVNCFSMTTEEALRKPGSIGKPMMFTQARLLASDGRVVPPNEVGELCLRGPHVCSGYWNNPNATAAALDNDGWFHTGDMARCDHEGFFYIVGRSKDMFISGGINVYPAEIEGELLRCPLVRDAAVIGVPNPKWGEVGVAFVVPTSPVTSEELIAFLAPKLAKYKLPREFVFVDALPRTAYGKVVKTELRESFDRRRPRNSSTDPLQKFGSSLS
ncbi:MAG: class I adenylate-forming enzyme family protein [Candidatus Sulfotelmatobacter sp.]